MWLNQYRAIETLKGTSLFLALTIASFGLFASARHAAAQPPADYRLVWSDEFDTLNLGDRPGAWLPYWRTWGVRHLSGNNDQAGKFADDETLEGGITAGAMLAREGRWGDGPYLHEASGGTLKLRAYPLSSAGRAKTFGFPFIAAMISGERLPAQNQGYWETRLRINRLGDGMHLGVWLLNDEHEWPPEIDILEVVGLDPALFHANTHVREGEAPYITGYRAPNGRHGWHVFGFEWTDDRMRWTVDGKTVREHDNLYGDDRLYFLVSWEIGGNWPGMPTGNTPWPGEVEIDYVRLYEQAPAGQTVTSSPAPTPNPPAPNTPTPSEAAPEPVSASEAPAPAAKPKPAAAPQPASEPEPVTAAQPTPAPEQPPQPTRTAEPEPQPPAASAAGEVATPESPPAPQTTVAPEPAAPPQWSLAQRLDMQRRMNVAIPQVPRQSAAPSTQPPPTQAPPSQAMPRSLADWQAMRDRASLFRFAD